MSSAPSAFKVVTRKLATGEVLLRPGEKVKSLYMIQSGRLGLCQVKNGRFVEVAQLDKGKAIADEAVFGSAQWQLTVLALRPTVVLEVPVAAVSDPLNLAPPWFKALVKALGERLKASFSDLKNLQVARDAVSCPPDRVAKLFGVIYHSARIVGKLNEAQTESTVDWDAFRKFAFEVFGEPVVRVEDGVTILLKLGQARFEGRKLHLSGLKNLESFFDYYGSYYFKGGYEDLLKTNSKIQKVTEEFLRIADRYPVDRGGQQTLPYKPTIDAMKKAMGGTFEADQLFRIEQKGLFLKRTATQDGGMISFYRADFDQMINNWKFLRELELWNEKGFVEGDGSSAAPSGGVSARQALDPVVERKKWAKALEEWKPAALEAKGAPKLRRGEKEAGEVWCSVCMGVLKKDQKVCSVCGAEVGSSQAA